MIAFLTLSELVVVVVILVFISVVPLALGFRLGRVPAGRPQRHRDAITVVDDGAASSAARPPDSRNDETVALLNWLRDAFDHITHAVVIADENGAEVFLNAAAERLRESRDGRMLVDKAANELLDDALAGKARELELELFGPPTRTFAVSAVPLRGPSGGGALVIVEDMTSQRLTETVRRDFVANISHELKSPIAAMGLLADMIHTDTDPGAVRRLSERMVGEADRAGRTIDDLLELATIEFSGGVEFEEIEAAELVAAAFERVAMSAESSGITMRVSDDFGGAVKVNRLQVVSALANLLDNALKYSAAGEDAGGGAGIEVRISGSADAGMVEFAVSDSGIGIPRRDLDRVFERFYRVDRARSRGTGGTGLGLAIVRHVATNHGGEVEVESTEGVGTTVVLRIANAPQSPDA